MVAPLGDAPVIATVPTRLRNDWSNFAIVEVTQALVTQALVKLAGDYADAFALRGYDSVQLAAAQILKAGASEAFCFARFDTRLQMRSKRAEHSDVGGTLGD